MTHVPRFQEDAGDIVASPPPLQKTHLPGISDGKGPVFLG